MFKKLQKNKGLIFPLAIVLLFSYAIAYGQANRAGGPNVTPGDGLVKNAAPESTAFHVLLGWAGFIQADTTKWFVTGGLDDSLATIHSAQTISGTKTFTSASGVLLGADGQDGKLTIFSEQGGTDYSLILIPNAAMTQSVSLTGPPDDGDAGQFMQTDGNGILSFATPSGSGDMLKTTYDIDEDGVVDSAETVSHGIISNLVHDSLAANWPTWLDGDADKSDIHDSMNTNLATSAGVLAFVGDETGTGLLVFGTSPTITSPTISTSIDLPANAVNAGTEIAVNIIDSTHIADGDLSEDDINWRSTRVLHFGEFSQMEGNSDSVDIFHVENDIIHNYIRFQNFSAQPGQICTTMTRHLMTADADTVVYEINTETITPDSSGIAIIIWKQSKVAGDTTRVYPKTGDPVLSASSVAETWLRKTIVGGDIDPISAGDVLLIATIAKVNAGRYAKCELVSPYAPGK